MCVVSSLGPPRLLRELLHLVPLVEGPTLVSLAWLPEDPGYNSQAPGPQTSGTTARRQSSSTHRISFHRPGFPDRRKVHQACHPSCPPIRNTGTDKWADLAMIKWQVAWNSGKAFRVGLKSLADGRRIKRFSMSLKLSLKRLNDTRGA